MGLRKNLISWDDLSEKKKASRSVSVSDFKAHYKTIAIKNSMILVLKKKHSNPNTLTIDQDRSQNKLPYLWSIEFGESCPECTMEKEEGPSL